MAVISAACVAVCVGAAVALTWLAVAGFVRLRAPLDRLHCAPFVSTGAGLLLTLASLAADGVSDQTGSVLVAAALNILAGTAGSVAIGRALRLRGSLPEVD